MESILSGYIVGHAGGWSRFFYLRVRGSGFLAGSIENVVRAAGKNTSRKRAKIAASTSSSPVLSVLASYIQKNCLNGRENRLI